MRLCTILRGLGLPSVKYLSEDQEYQRCLSNSLFTNMAALRSHRGIKKTVLIWTKGIFLLLAANFHFVGTSVTWTAPPPTWTQTDPNDIRTVDILVFNRSTQVPLKWNYTRPVPNLRTTTFSIDDGVISGDIGVIYHGSNTISILNTNDYRTRFNISRSEVATLIISEATKREEATFECKLTTSDNAWVYKIRVKLTELQLHWDEVPSNVSTVEEGANITLQWTYSYTLGLETPSFRLAKFTDLRYSDEGKEIANKLSGNDLLVDQAYRDWDIHILNEKASITITTVRRSVSGRYKFEVETSSNGKIGRLTSIVNISVQFAANLTNVSLDHIVLEGSKLQLFCEATGEPTPNITWTKVLEDGSNSEVLHRGPTWDFPNINRTTSGTYRCTADNRIGNPVTHKVKVNVTYPAKIVKLASEHKVTAQQSVSLHCEAEGNPQPSYTWTPCEPEQNTCHDSMLDISEVMDDTVYTCNVTNVLGNDSKTTSLVIASTVINVTLVITSESCTDGKYSQASLEKKLAETIDEIFKSESNYESTTLSNVRCGSIIVDLALQFSTVVKESNVLSMFKDASKNGMLGDFRVNASAIVGTRPQTGTTGTTLPSSSPAMNVTPVPDKSDDDKPLEDWMIAVIAAIAGAILITLVVVLLYCFKIRKKSYGADDIDMSPTSSYVVGGPEVSRTLDRRSYGFESVEDDPFILAASTQSLNSTDDGKRKNDPSVNYGYSSYDSVHQPEMLLNPGSRAPGNRSITQSTEELNVGSSYLVSGPQRDARTLPPYFKPPSFDEAMLQSGRKMKNTKSTGDLTEPRPGRYANQRPIQSQAKPTTSSLGPQVNKGSRKEPLDPTVPYATPHKKTKSNKHRAEHHGPAAGHLPQYRQEEKYSDSTLQHTGDLNLDDPSNMPPNETPPELPSYQVDPDYDLPEPRVDRDSRSDLNDDKPNYPSHSSRRKQFKPYVNVYGQIVRPDFRDPDDVPRPESTEPPQEPPTPNAEISSDKWHPPGYESEDDIDYVTYVV